MDEHPRCATCTHWEYADLYTPEWDTERVPDTHLFAWGTCALFNDPARALFPVRCGTGATPEIDTHWTFGCILHEPSPGNSIP
jgi:hypothetical protein